jgi:hypothetical protein
MRHYLVLASVLAAGCIAVPGGKSEPASSSESSLRSGPRQTACEVFENAVCVCDDLAQAGSLHVNGSVGVDGDFSAATSSRIDGDVIAWKGLSMAGDLEIDGNLETAGSVSGAGTLTVGKDLVTQGNVSFAGHLDVRGQRVHGSPKNMPCDCNDTKLLDVAAAVTRASATATHIDASTLSSISEGRWYVKGDLTTAGLAHMVVDGHASLYVDGSIESAGERRIELRPGATLDLYIAGSLSHAGEIAFGDPDRPSAFRMFVGGTDDVLVAAGLQNYSGLIYAPHARVSFAGETNVRGAIFAKSISYAGDLHVDFAAPERTTCIQEPSVDGGAPDAGNDASSDDGGSNADASGHDAGSCGP